MTVESNWLTSFANLEGRFFTESAWNGLFIEIGLAFTIFYIVKTFIYLEFYLLAGYFNGLFGLAWRLFIQLLFSLQVLVAILNRTNETSGLFFREWTVGSRERPDVNHLWLNFALCRCLKLFIYFFLNFRLIAEIGIISLKAAHSGLKIHTSIEVIDGAFDVMNGIN